ncbi:EAL domain-containing protein [Aquisalimonas sp. 2447]|uniref:putative bifunctional diguanylate cyclase/phosphodiesterase n=1 Tax=Aquisalimonas sp. 2447 TaxID=2740807 RepID=UPI0014325D5E|nr:EAL domain-containing protein [Aquisalimonas sp. 2447]QIT55273.1 EAL domain-containing protein [Aquisalimonas sp. 2447]
MTLPQTLGPEAITFAQTIKGWSFIVVTAVMLWLLIQRLSDRQALIIGDLELHKRILENAHNGVLVTNGNGEIIYVNEALERITGYRQEELLGRNPSVLSSGFHDREFYRQMWETLERDHAWQGEIVNRRKDGNRFTEWITITKIVDGTSGDARYVSVISDISKAKADQDRLQYLAFHDPLTSLPNRALMQEHLKTALHQAALERNQIAVLFLDLDDFKIINETLGHQTGDLILKQVARRLSGVVDDAALGRFSGDQFILITPAVESPDQVAGLAERLLESLSEPLRPQGHHPISVRCTVGITVSDGMRDVSEEGLASLLSEADAALNEAKTNGKNGFAFYSSDMMERSQRRLELEQALSHAIQNDELRLHFQPVFDVGSEQLVGAEALLRWAHPHRGLISPGEFIPVAEETGLILPLGEWVMQALIGQIQRWLDAGLDPGVVAFNVASRQVAQGEFSAALTRALASHERVSHHLEVELTESGLMSLGDGTIDKLHAVQSSGVRLAVDDFGTGYSSLAYLRRFPLNKLKIDRSFIAELHDDNENEAIIRAILAMAHTLNLKVQAEGVETREQLLLLRELGCDTWQGFLGAAPLPAEGFEAGYLRTSAATGPWPHAVRGVTQHRT